MPFSENLGDNREFGVASPSDVTVYFTGGPTGVLTSTSDTATTKYTDSLQSIRAFALRSDQTVQIVSINSVTFTEPITVTADKTHVENLDIGIITSMVIRTLTANTNIKLRVRG